MKDEITWHIDGSSFIQDGTRYAVAAVTIHDEVTWAEALPPGTSAQRPEQIDSSR